MQKNIFCFISLISLLTAAMFSTAQVIPDSVRVEWGRAGVEDSIPSYTTVVDVTTLGAIANDTGDDYPAVAAAINGLNGNSGVVYFPPGNYVIKSTITLPDSVIIRGAGSDSTTLTFNLNNTTANSFNILRGQGGSFSPLLSGYSKGSDKIVVSGASSLFSPGDHIEIREANGAWDTNPAVWATYSVGHLANVISTDGDTLVMSESLRMNLDSALHPEIRKIIPRTSCGLECFKMTRIDSAATSVNYGVYFNYATNCWMRGVESHKSLGAHVTVETASHIFISGCYFHESYIYDGASTNGYGVMLITHSCSNIIEDNIFRKLRHAMIAKQGANGNVFGYNYSIQPNRSEFPADFGADICLHGHYAFANLFEGNISQNLSIDQAWGPSGPFNTFFRNKLELWGIVMSSGTVQSDGQNFVGNDVTNTNFPYGQYLLAGTNHFEYGNNIQGTIIPSGTGALSDTSYYLDTIPPRFWNISQTLPSIGTPIIPANDNNPARQRYINGGKLTLCGFQKDSMITNVQQLKLSELKIKSFLHRGGIINLTIESDKEYANTVMKIFSMAGQQLVEEKIEIQTGVLLYSLKSRTTLLPGLYMIDVSAGEKSISKKIVVAAE